MILGVQRKAENVASNFQTNKDIPSWLICPHFPDDDEDTYKSFIVSFLVQHAKVKSSMAQKKLKMMSIHISISYMI